MPIIKNKISNIKKIFIAKKNNKSSPILENFVIKNVEPVVKRSMPEYLSNMFYSLFNKKKITFSNGTSFEVIPYYYEVDFNSKKKIFILSNKNGHGTFSSIYLTYYDKNNNKKTKKTDIIFKKTDYLIQGIDKKQEELFGLYFNYFLYKYYESNHPDSLKYLCKLNEFGEIKGQKSFYAYMNNCGKELKEISKSNIKQDELNKFIKILFTQCLESIKLLHDLDYLHLDIKDPNFLFVSPSHHELYIKIIDFGMI